MMMKQILKVDWNLPSCSRPQQQVSHHRSFHHRRFSALKVRASAQPGDIKLIATDVDGTLLNSAQMLTPRVQQAVLAASAAGVPLAVATGKARGPWAQEVLPRLQLQLPGVFLQGLIICDADGEVLYSRQLPEDVTLEVIDFADQHGLTLTAYCGDRILTRATDAHTDRLLFYREPTPEAVGPLNRIVGQIDIQKMILMGSPDRINEIRPLAEAQFSGRVSFTTALPGMLEVLPLGASKGAGVAWLLDHLSIAPETVMALGDGENDVEMLQLVGFGIAMGNAGPAAKFAAKFVTGGNDEDGVAQAIERFVLQPRGIRLQRGVEVVA